MGTEFGLANYPDIVDEVVGSKKAMVPGQRDYLYPLALQVPGLLHIIDGVMKRCIEAIPFWPSWQHRAKVIVQYTHGQSHRDFLKGILARSVSCPQELARLQDSLSTATARFAHWRWKTLNTAISDLLRCEEALRTVGSVVIAGKADFGCRDKAIAESLRGSITDPEFWQQCRALQFVIARLVEFQSWCQGCDCHEEERLSGQRVICNLKGCRAKSIARRVTRLCEELAADRDALVPGRFGHCPMTPLLDAVTQAISGIQTKLHWVHELPYLIWQAIGCKQLVSDYVIYDCVDMVISSTIGVCFGFVV